MLVWLRAVQARSASSFVAFLLRSQPHESSHSLSHSSPYSYPSSCPCSILPRPQQSTQAATLGQKA